ncbi:enoyl-CoA hydratase [Variovorax paradoxus]|nr:enoyl-CoA hydratase [Variovorax paradoxus]MBT2301981.1 enoyl-CoA hydratase [Variovorax paradoxus]
MTDAATAYANLRVTRSDAGFATIVLNRPEKLNTLSIALRRELAEAVAALEADPGVHVLILTGEGRAFTAGMDLDEWDADGGVAARAYELDAVKALQQFSGPLIGAINGMAITGGLEIALSCDLLLASSEARFADTHVKVGLLPGWGGSARLLRRVGIARAKEIALTGGFFSAAEAHAWGMVNHVYAPERLQGEAEALALRMLQNPPAGLIAYKRLLDAESGCTLEESLRIEREASVASNRAVTRQEIESRLARLRRQGR